MVAGGESWLSCRLRSFLKRNIVLSQLKEVTRNIWKVSVGFMLRKAFHYRNWMSIFSRIVGPFSVRCILRFLHVLSTLRVVFSSVFLFFLLQRQYTMNVTTPEQTSPKVAGNHSRILNQERWWAAAVLALDFVWIVFMVGKVCVLWASLRQELEDS